MTNIRAFVILAMAIVLVVSVTALCLYNYYVFLLNATSHTSMDVRQLALDYFILAAISGVLLRYANHKIVVLCLIVGVLGAAEMFLLDYFEVMSSYDDWASRGLNSRTVGCWFLHCS
jgi:hypothetical protein